MISPMRRLELADAAALVADDASVAIGRPPALALVRELIRAGRRDRTWSAYPRATSRSSSWSRPAAPGRSSRRASTSASSGRRRPSRGRSRKAGSGFSTRL